MTFHKCILCVCNSVMVHEDIRHSMLESNLETFIKFPFETTIYPKIE